jgi:hypothetical protein
MLEIYSSVVRLGMGMGVCQKTVTASADNDGVAKSTCCGKSEPLSEVAGGRHMDSSKGDHGHPAVSAFSARGTGESITEGANTAGQNAMSIAIPTCIARSSENVRR